jgi:hypothetical protein
MLNSHAPNARQTHKGEESPNISPSGCLLSWFLQANALAGNSQGVQPLPIPAYQTHKKPRQKQQGIH